MLPFLQLPPHLLDLDQQVRVQSLGVLKAHVFEPDPEQPRPELFVSGQGRDVDQFRAGRERAPGVATTRPRGKSGAVKPRLQRARPDLAPRA